MIKICHITTGHNTNDIRIFQKECVSLAKKDEYKVYFVGPGKSRSERNVEIIGVGTYPSSRFERVTSHAKKIVKAALELKADVYHFHDPELLLYIRKLKSSGAIIIFDSHEDYKQQILTRAYLPKSVRKTVAGIYKLIEDNACKMIDAAIIPCPVNGRHIFMGRVKSCAYINNYPLLIKNSVNSEFSVKKDKIVCYTGSISEARGVGNLIKACYEVGAKLILAGPFDSEQYKADLENRKEYECVDYRGYCSKEEIIEIYNQTKVGANILLNVGQYKNAQNLSTKVYEYMMMGIPFVINNSEFNVEFLRNYQCGIAVNPSNIQEISNAIEKLLNNDNTCKRMGDIGRAIVREKYNWDVEEKKLYKLYEMLLQENTKDKLNVQS